MQDPPNCIQIEPVEGCNLYCDFCGLRGIREHAGGPYFEMSPATAEMVARQIATAGWMPRIEFAMHGEPTMHGDLPNLIAIFRHHLPHLSLMLTSNGGGLAAGDPVAYAVRLFEAGLNTLALDDYAGIRYVPSIREPLHAWADTQHIPWYEYPENPLGHPHRRLRPRARRITIIQDIREAARGSHAHLSNHAGAAAPRNGTMAGKRCARPFRELSIRYNGRIALCCNDWRGEFETGAVQELPLADIWQDRPFAVARRKLYHGQRNFGPCNGCDDRSYRVGLLPDRMGKTSLPIPSADDERYLCDRTAQPPLSLIVIQRPWELEQAR